MICSLNRLIISHAGKGVPPSKPSPLQVVCHSAQFVCVKNESVDYHS